VIGVAADVRQLGPEQAVSPEIYVPAMRFRQVTVVVRSEQAPAVLVAPIAKGFAVGTMAVMQDGKEIASIPVVAQAAVPAAGFFKRMKDKLRMKL